MKLINTTNMATVLVLAMTSIVYGQEKPAVSAAPVAASPATEPAKSESFLRFEGTDLHIGNFPPLTFHGFGSQGFLVSDTYDYLGQSKSGSFEFTEVAVNVSMSPFARTRISAQGFLFGVGNVGGYSPGLDYAQIDYSLRSEIGFRAGRIRRPEGIYNSIQDIDLTRTSILLPQGMYDARYRDFSASIDGGSIYGDIGLGKAGSLSYEVYGGMVNLSADGGVARLLQDSLRNPPTQFVGVNGFPQFGCQLWWSTPLSGLRAGAALSDVIGFSYDYNLNIPPGFGGGRYRNQLDSPVAHLSLEYQWKAWTFQAEYKYAAYLNTQAHHNGSATDMPGSATDVWYVGAAYRVNNWFEVGTYYTEDYADVTDRSGKDKAVSSDAFQKDFALSLRFDPKPWWVVKLEGHVITGTALLNDTKDNPKRNEDPWFMLGVKTTFSF